MMPLTQNRVRLSCDAGRRTDEPVQLRVLPKETVKVASITLRETPHLLDVTSGRAGTNWFDPNVTAVPAIRPRTSSAHLPVCMATGNSFPGQVTIGSSLTAEVPFTGVRLILANYSGSPLIFAGLCVARSASMASSFQPLDGDGTASEWLPVTAGGAVPVVPSGAADRPSIVLSDLVPVESIDRIDGGTGFLLFTRAAGPRQGENHINQTAVISTTAGFAEETPGRPISNWYVGGDHASDPATLDPATTAPVADVPFFLVAGAIFQSPERCITIMGVGDSLTQGLTAGVGYSGFARHAASVLGSPTLAVSYVDASYSGQTTAQFTARATDLIQAGIPVDILTVPIDSPNDYAAGVSRIRQEATILSFVDFALSRGIAVVLVTSIPCNAMAGDVGHGLDRMTSSSKLRRSRQPGLLLLDAQAIISGCVPTPSQPPKASVDLLGADAVHLNGIAHAMLGDELARLLTPYLR